MFDILDTVHHLTFSLTGSVSIFRWQVPIQMGPLDTASFSHWRLAQ